MPDAKIVPATGEIVAHQQWLDVIPDASDGEDVAEQIALRILASENVDDLLTPSAAEGLRDWIDRPIVIHDVRKREGEQEGVKGWYFILDIEDQKTGKHHVATTGASNVMAQITKAHNSGWLPMPCKVIEMVSASNPSHKPQWLVKLDNF